MSMIVIFDEGASPERVLQLYRRADPARYRGTTGWLLEPDISMLDGIVPQKYWKHVGGIVVEYTQGEKDTQDAAEAAAHDLAVRVGAKGLFTGFSNYPIALKALASIIIDELNTLRTLHSLPDRTLNQLKTAIEARIDSGQVDS